MKTKRLEVLCERERVGKSFGQHYDIIYNTVGTFEVGKIIIMFSIFLEVSYAYAGCIY